MQGPCEKKTLAQDCPESSTRIRGGKSCATQRKSDQQGQWPRQSPLRTLPRRQRRNLRDTGREDSKTAKEWDCRVAHQGRRATITVDKVLRTRGKMLRNNATRWHTGSTKGSKVSVAPRRRGQFYALYSSKSLTPSLRRAFVGSVRSHYGSFPPSTRRFFFLTCGYEVRLTKLSQGANSHARA